MMRPARKMEFLESLTCPNATAYKEQIKKDNPARKMRMKMLCQIYRLFEK